ncbi:hypothetical protein FACS1894155_05390 [Bacteroidia bacterium]|nr:hypothetical protein FACS1894155_05390 [Bacteroidia bacterium]
MDKFNSSHAFFILIITCRREQEVEERIHTIMEYDELLRDVFRLECQLFMKMDSYRLIEQKCSKKCFNLNERQLLNEDIHSVFIRLIKIIKEACPDLTGEDVMFCCLSRIGLDNSVICRCMGSVSKQTINQRKYRIKKKMREAECDSLFEMIFVRK